MGLKDKLFEMVAEEAIRRIAKTETANEVFNKFTDVAVKLAGEKTIDEYKLEATKKYMYFKAPSASIGTMIDIMHDKGKFISEYGTMHEFCDINGNVKYITDYDLSLFIDRNSITLYDINKNKIGKIKEKIISIGIPLMEKEVKVFDVFQTEYKVCTIKKYKSFDELYFQTLVGELCICAIKEKKIFEIKRGDSLIAKVSILPPKFVDKLVEHYLIEYEDVTDEKQIALMTCALFYLMRK